MTDRFSALLEQVNNATQALERGDLEGALAIVEPLTPARLTQKQARRAAAAIAGEPLSAIAKAEGVSKQSVAETLRAPAVRKTILELLDQIEVTNKKTNSTTTLVQHALVTLGNLLQAEKPVVFGASYAMEPDNAVRLAAAMKILELYQPVGSAASEPAAPTAVVDEVVERTSTTVARRRSATA